VGAEELLPVLGDFDAYPLWMPGCDRAELVERGDPTKPIYATRLFLSLGSPFPFSDRDIELLVENRLNPADGLWEFTSRALSASESSRKPNKGVVRIEKSTGRWSFRRAGPGATAIEYQWHSDPGGNLPAWLANRVTRTVPLEAVGNLIARAKCLRAAPADNPGCVFE
jgi:ribosome-associated toxin RatA of RatAB toxin-antitoxin module